MLCCVPWCCFALSRDVWYWVELLCFVLCCVVLFCFVLCNVVLSGIVLLCLVLCGVAISVSLPSQAQECNSHLGTLQYCCAFLHYSSCVVITLTPALFSPAWTTYLSSGKKYMWCRVIYPWYTEQRNKGGTVQILLTKFLQNFDSQASWYLVALDQLMSLALLPDSFVTGGLHNMPLIYM